MGTRADFYVGRGKSAEWLGSIAWDGYPSGISLTLPDVEYVVGIQMRKHEEFLRGAHLFDASTEQQFRERVNQFFANRDDVTMPEMGWPWPWEDSCTTDYAYAFDGGKVYGSYRGTAWFEADKPQPEEPDETGKVEVPNMKSIKKTTLGRRSGVIVVSR